MPSSNAVWLTSTCLRASVAFSVKSGSSFATHRRNAALNKVRFCRWENVSIRSSTSRAIPMSSWLVASLRARACAIEISPCCIASIVLVSREVRSRASQTWWSAA